MKPDPISILAILFAALTLLAVLNWIVREIVQRQRAEKIKRDSHEAYDNHYRGGGP